MVTVEECELEGSATLAGRLTRRRSVARGHSIWLCPLISNYIFRAIANSEHASAKLVRAHKVPLCDLQQHDEHPHLQSCSK